MFTLLLSLLACADPATPDTPGTDTPISPDTDPSPRTWTRGPAFTPTAPDSDAPPPELVLHVEPVQPRWDQDLRCVVTGDTTRAFSIEWQAEGVRMGPMADGERPGDTVPHLRQAGGQRWACYAVFEDGAYIGSEAVRIEPPVPMSTIAGGSFSYPPYFPNTPVTLAQDYLLAQYEMSRAEWATWTTPAPPVRWAINDEAPVTSVNWHWMTYVANLMSEADGLTACASCRMVDGVPTCDAPSDPYACEGYRLPTHTEWAFGCSERGRHSDPVPNGGAPGILPNWQHSDDVFLYGPFAVPGSRLSDFCHYDSYLGYLEARSASPPNLAGLVGMCGNAPDAVLDGLETSYLTPGVSAVNPYHPLEPGEMHLESGGTFESSPNNVGCGIAVPTSLNRQATTSTFRPARTLTAPRIP